MVAPPLVVGVRDERSIETVAWATDLAVAAGAPVAVVHAVPGVPPPEEFGIWPWTPDLTELARWISDDLCQPLRVGEVPHWVHVVPGPVAGALAAAAQRLHASAIVVGHRQRRLWRRQRRLTSALTGDAGCAVIAVPHIAERLNLEAPGFAQGRWAAYRPRSQ